MEQRRYSGYGVIQEAQEPAAQTRGLSKDTELPEYGRSIVIDLFSRKLTVFIEDIHSAQRKFEPPPGWRKAARHALVRTTNQALDNDSLAAYVFLPDFNPQIGESPEELFVEQPNRFPPLVVFIPRLVIVPCGQSKRIHDGGEIMSILKTDVIPCSLEPLIR